MKYRAEIDGLRAFAVIPVILFHAGFKIFSGGFSGVDIFFVISGYLITLILIEDLENSQLSIINFYERRVRRILPALFFVMLCCIPFAWIWMSPFQLKEFSQSLVVVSLFASNIFFWRENNYFATGSEEKPLLHTWSLAVEEQYYMLFPVFLFFVWRFGKNYAFLIIILFSVFSFSLSEWGWRNQPIANFYLTPTRAWELLTGSITAFIVSKRGVQSNNILAIIGLLAIIFSIFFYSEKTPFPSFYSLVPVIGTALLILFAGEKTLTAKFLSNKIFVGIGLVSYSAYLWHQPLFAFARIVLIEPPPIWLMLSLSISSIALAFFSWKFIEKPFRGKSKKINSRIFIFSLSLCSLLLFIIIGLYGHFNNGFQNRFNRMLIGDTHHLEYFKYVDEKYPDCEPKNISDRALIWEGFLRCKQTKKGDASLILLGDSHAEHLFLGLAENLPSKNIAFYILGGKPYIENEKFNYIFDFLLSSKKPKKILLTMYYFHRLGRSNDLSDGFENTIHALQEAGHEVALVGDIPAYKIQPEACLYFNDINQIEKYCNMKKEEFSSQESFYKNTLINLSKKFSIKYYKISEPLCNKIKCSMLSGNTILYRDTHHLNIPGSIIIGKYLADILE